MPGKVKYNALTVQQKKQYLGEFYSMVALLKSRDEVKNFFKDLLTLSEVVMISRRIQVAKLLLRGFTNEEIRKELKVGFTTINQVNRWLENGFGGYKKTIKEFEKQNSKKGKDYDPQNSVPYSPSWVRRKYPLHYLLSNLLSNK